MIKFLVVVGIIIAMIFSPVFTCAICNPHLTIGYGGFDLFHWFKYRAWRNAKSGKLICYTGLFGKGKTLSATHDVVHFYRRYNDKQVFIKGRGFVTQRVLILSNVELKSVPFVPFESLRQLVDLTDDVRKFDVENGTVTFILVLGDEFSVQLNSRNFKTNIDALFLNTLLTCRHYHINIYYTSQRFSFVDALLRQVTQTVVDCDKLWRFQRQKIYDAYQLENCTNPTLVQPIGRWCWFVRNKDYNAYDTLACVKNLEHSVVTNDMMSSEDILKSIAPENVDSVVNYSRKAKKRRPFKIK